MIEIHKLGDAGEITAEAALLTAEKLAETLNSQGRATFVLAGGRLPPVAAGILSDQYGNAFDWRRVQFLIGDERCVPLDDPDSSWNSFRPMFDAHPEIPTENILRPLSDLPSEEAADLYAKTLLALPKNHQGRPALTTMWFGIGEDGHTLSIFPNHPSSVQETDQLVIPVYNSPKPPSDRISFTYKTLESVELAIVFISGESKAPAVAQIANGDHSLPVVVASKTITKAGGRVIWLIDEAALSEVSPGQELKI